MIKKRTRVYVDGFNIYYGIRFTPYRWLDLGRLARLLVPNVELDAIRYFTARIEARDDPDQPQRQTIYLRALQTIPNLSIHFGQFRSNQVRMALVWCGLVRGEWCRSFSLQQALSESGLDRGPRKPAWSRTRPDGTHARLWI